MRAAGLIATVLLAAGCGAGTVANPGVVDADRDGYTTAIDCNDSDPAVYPSAPDRCGDGIDQDCSGTDELCPVCDDGPVADTRCTCAGALSTSGICCSDALHADGYCCAGVWQASVCTTCEDADSDGFSDAACGGDDCNDRLRSIHPGALDVCGDDTDQDCTAGDPQCSDCGDGAVPASGCSCAGAIETSGYCCGGVLQASVCQTGGIVIDQALVLSATLVRDGETLSGSVTYRNSSTTTTIDLLEVAIAARPPGGTHGGGPFENLLPYQGPLSLEPGESVTVDAARVFSSADALGQWEAYPTYQDDGGAWHDGPSQYFTVALACTPATELCGDGIDQDCSGADLACPATAPMTCAHRTTGVAPLAVFFDAIDTDGSEGPSSPFVWTSGVFQPTDYEGTHYAWDFGDPASGTWAQTGLSRNAATGYTAAHVFETPGSYTVTLTQTDPTGAVRAYSQTITVTAFSGTTYYVAAAPTGSDTNNGLSEGAPFATVARALQEVGSNVRILFRRGDTFNTGTDHYTISVNGPGIIGAYGTGARPVLSTELQQDYQVIQFRGPAKTTPIDDWRVMDLEFVGPGGVGTSAGAISFNVEYTASNFLFLRLRFAQWNVGFGWGDWTPIFAYPRDSLTVMECESDAAYQNGMYLGGYRLALLGNDIHDVGYSHALRVWQAHKAVISNNRLWKPGGQRHALKLHGPNTAVLVAGVYSPFGTPGGTPVEPGRETCPATRWVTISDNIVKGSDTSQWSISIGPQDSISDERLSHIVYERNRHSGSPSTLIDIEASACQVMIRNNLIDATLDGYFTGVYVHRRGIEPIPADYRIYNNTFYKGSANTETTAFDIGAEVTNAVIRNNLLAIPGTGTGTLVVGGGGSGWVFDHNVSTATPLFTDAAGGDFSLASGSPAIDAGATLTEVREDFARGPRPVGLGYDVGAYESQ